MRTLPASLTVAVLLFAGSADARTWTVGGPRADFPFIAPAIAAAADGDTIRVARGVYREDLLVDKRLAIVGDGRPTLFGTGLGTVVTITADGCELRGFSIEGSGLGQTNEMDAAVQIQSNGNRVVDNHLRRVFFGVVVTDGRRNEIADNTIEGLRDLAFGRRGDGIYLYRAPDNVVARNRVSGERDAIYFQYAPRGQALDNIVSDSRYGLHDMFSDEAVIARNAFTDSAVGANIMNSRRIRIDGNQIRRNRGIPGVGLTLKDCDDSTVVGNAIAENARGLLVDGSSSNRFSNNAFRANDTAVTLFSSAERNQFGGNEFVDNWSDVVFSGADSGTRWSIDERGNYWARYRGFDFDGDGIGDAPHPIAGAFERIEGANGAARIFLQSPAAAGLELAARLRGRLAHDTVDDHPLAQRRRGPDAVSPGTQRSPARTGTLGRLLQGGRSMSTLFALFAATAIVVIRRKPSC
jgi:nitrous oxidase accessory protein